jgi:hypothetical protein
MEVVGFRCNPWRWYRGERGGIHMNRGRVGEKRGGKEMDGCPLTDSLVMVGSRNDNPNITTLEYTKDKYNVKIIKQ